MQPIPKAFRTL